MKIRKYGSNDLDEVIQLWNECGLVVPHNSPRRDIERKLSCSPEMFMVGEVDGKVKATCMIGYEGHRGWINYLAVKPEFQGRGYGTLLMKKAEELLREIGCPKINLMVRSTNQKVIEFYRSMGFNTDDVVCMGKRLVSDERQQAQQ